MLLVLRYISSRITDNCLTYVNVVSNHCAGPDYRAITDLDSGKYHRSRADPDFVPYLNLAVSTI
jgi:hypothetical protein